MWIYSPAYGRRVLLGPVQARLWAFLDPRTAQGRRVEFTARDLASRIGAALSSTFVALRRLRALGVVGVQSTAGAHGSQRIWRETHRSAQPLALGAGRRRTIARVLALWGAIRPRLALILPVDPGPVPPEPAGRPEAEAGSHRPPPPLDPFGVTPAGWRPPRAGDPEEGDEPDPRRAGPPTREEEPLALLRPPDGYRPPREGETFAEKMRRHGLREDLAQAFSLPRPKR